VKAVIYVRWFPNCQCKKSVEEKITNIETQVKGTRQDEQN